MSTGSSSLRAIQVTCALAVLAGVLPWSQLAGQAVTGAIQSEGLPLTLSVAAWAVLLLPLWVGWFGLRAWEQRNVSCTAAVVMAVPSLVVTAIMVAFFSKLTVL